MFKINLTKQITDIDGNSLPESVGSVLANILYNAQTKPTGMDDIKVKEIIHELRKEGTITLSVIEISGLNDFIKTINHNGLRIQITDEFKAAREVAEEIK